MYDLAIIGAGISGMSCAHFAAQAGLRALVLEKSGTPGGWKLFQQPGVPLTNNRAMATLLRFQKEICSCHTFSSEKEFVNSLSCEFTPLVAQLRDGR